MGRQALMVNLRYLLDTHTLLWVVRGSDRLSASAKKALGDPTAQCFVSAASAYEIMYKHNFGKLNGYEDIAESSSFFSHVMLSMISLFVSSKI